MRAQRVLGGRCQYNSMQPANVHRGNRAHKEVKRLCKAQAESKRLDAPHTRPKPVPAPLHVQDRAAALLVRMHTDSSFNVSRSIWWDSQPAPGELLCPELLPPGELGLLQSSWLVS